MKRMMLCLAIVLIAGPVSAGPVHALGRVGRAIAHCPVIHGTAVGLAKGVAKVARVVY